MVSDNVIADSASLTVENIIALTQTIIDQVEEKVISNVDTLFLQDGSTPGNPDEEVQPETVVELAISIAIGHLSTTYSAQFY